MTQLEINEQIPKQVMPITIITGFLGSGKTTLLNQILKNSQDLKVAVLVNEFGDIDIDSQLLISVDEDMVQLSNGCICCTINSGLVEAVCKVLERETPVDYLVIETTGVADPLPIIQTFLGTKLRELTRLDSIVTMVDVENFIPEHFNSDAALHQIIYGDIILLNKTDLVSPERVDDLENYINSIKQAARIIRCQYGQVPLPFIMDVGYTNPDVFAGMLETQDKHHHSDHLANDGFVSVSFTSTRPFSLTKFQDFLDNLPTNVFRGKGILWFWESQLKHIFQLSGKRCSLDTQTWTTVRSNQIVFIGRNLDAKQLRQELSRCHQFDMAELSASNWSV
ncbi:MAG: GTP-binding protein [Pelatocladus maniniholoensis HA4357-MV3]|uniref:GTP-binding protein n=1 Tax=Pelatocladus maniniholoensis HA4357-MV3 TaxID=1117104 RepID=A0A9E3H5C1_9NOST|nr:GTP-binding protein [Pelatocladus maniniholoensis HA4357-MV3]